MSEKRSDILTLKKVRLSFPKIFEKTRTNEEGPEKYTLSALMDPGTPEGKANIEAVKAMQTRLAKATWKDNWEKVLKATEWTAVYCAPATKPPTRKEMSTPATKGCTSSRQATPATSRF